MLQSQEKYNHKLHVNGIVPSSKCKRFLISDLFIIVTSVNTKVRQINMHFPKNTINVWVNTSYVDISNKFHFR